MRLEAKDLLSAGAMASNPMLGLGANLVRHRGLGSSDTIQHLGKSLAHHQVLPATLAKRVANAPRTDIGKAVLSATGGNPLIVNQAQSLARGVSKISHFDSKRLMREGVSQALKHAPMAKSLISH